MSPRFINTDDLEVFVDSLADSDETIEVEWEGYTAFVTVDRCGLQDDPIRNAQDEIPFDVRLHYADSGGRIYKLSV